MGSERGRQLRFSYGHVRMHNHQYISATCSATMSRIGPVLHWSAPIIGALHSRVKAAP